VLLIAPAARADLASLKASCKTTDAVDGKRSNAILIPYRFCDDGLPPVGGRTPNERVKRAVAVPEKYNGYAGLPAAVDPDPNSGADANGSIALDANVALPDPKRHPRPRGGYPLIVLLHGCCPGSKDEWHGTIDAQGDRWHYTDAWFAARGYVVLSYTSRGFVNADGRGSTGETQLGHRAYEVNDLQYLAGLLAEDPFFGVNPDRVVVSGDSYGAGVAWLALTDPVWRSPHKRIKMELAAVAPKDGWSDLANALVPNGRYLQGELAPIDPDTAFSRSPLGAAKRSLIADSYSSGVTLPQPVVDAFACLGAATPFAANPICPVVPGVLDSFIRERSAYFQERFFGRMAINENWRIPVFSAGSFSDQLYPLEEQRRMGTMLRHFVSNYPIQEYYGDYGTHAQNKDKEWADLCQNNRHVCSFGEFKRGFNVRPVELMRLGIAGRLNRFIDHYAHPPGNEHQARPRRNVVVALQTCSQNANRFWPADEPGERFEADSFEQLAPNRWVPNFTGARATSSDVSPNPHADEADPVRGPCAAHTSPAGAGVATYDSAPLAGDVTMIGQTRVTASVQGAAAGLQLNARLYDLFPDGRQVLVDRGVRTLTDGSGTVALDLHGNAWRFFEGHRVRLELAQDDDPYVRRSDQAGTITITQASLSVPIREIAPGNSGESGPDLRLRVSAQAGGGFDLKARSPTGERVAIDDYEFFVRDATGAFQPLPETDDRPRRRSFAGTTGTTYTFAARAVDDRGVRGPLAIKSAVAR
jgi:X-Pro dipeptidyl-peptidase-like protein